MTVEITLEEILDAVESVARETLWEADVAHPPVDAMRIALRMGCVIAGGRGRSRAERVRLGGSLGGEVILLSPEDRPERRQWSVAHELGEVLAPRIFAQLGASPRDTPAQLREEAANRFATSLLLPSRWFLPDAGDRDWDLASLKQVYTTASHELIARRILELHGGAIAVTVIDNGAQTWRHGNRWPPPPPCPVELDVWRRALERGEPADSLFGADGVTRVRAWPVHEPDWRREILLTEFEED